MIGSGAAVFAVWGYVIAHMRPPKFEVELNPVLLAFILGEPEEVVVKAIEKLCSPDVRSRSKAEDGRRLIKLGEYLYHVVNGETYNAIRSNAEMQAYWRDQKKRKRQAEIGVGNHEVDRTELIPDTSDTKSETYHKDSRTVLHILNQGSGRAFREIDSNLGFISARLSEPGVDLAGMKLMISRQCQMWNGTTMAEYLRPETLFNKTKFDGYYAARTMPIETKTTNAKPPGPKITTQADAVNRTMREIEQATQRAMRL